MQRWTVFVTVVAALGASMAHAQPLSPSCYSPDRLGWAGPRVELGCLPCCGCRSADYEIEWQVRNEDAGWAGQNLDKEDGRIVSGPFPGLTHLRRYCMRTRFADDFGAGQWGPSNGTTCSDGGSDLCFTWDSAPPTPPVLLDAGVIPGTNVVELYFAPSTDDGGGVRRYSFRYLPSGAPPVGAFGNGPSSPISDVLGPGTHTVAVFAEDRAENVSANSAAFTVTLGFDASIAPAAAPSWNDTLINDNYEDLTWSNDGAQSWVVTQRTADGGWAVNQRPRVAGLSALLSVPGPCRRHAARIARVFGDQVSDWSPPSPELLVDQVAPVPAPPQLVGLDGGFAHLAWAPAVDACPSGVQYQLERSVNGGSFVVRAATGGTESLDALPAAGVITWRVVALDGAENRGVSDGGVTLVLGLDAGAADAGEADAGTPDAGAGDGGQREPDGGVDAGEPDPRPDAGTEVRRLSVGCGCDAGATLVPALAAWALRRRRARSGGSHP